MNYVRDVDVRSLADDEALVCRMVAPTGSRIHEERCSLKDEALEQRRHDATREQVDRLREQQMNLEQAREHARAQSVRGIMSGGGSGR